MPAPTQAQLAVIRKAQEGVRLSELSGYEQQIAKHLMKLGRIKGTVLKSGDWLIHI